MTTLQTPPASEVHSFSPRDENGYPIHLLIEPMTLPPIIVQDVRSGKRYEVTPHSRDFPFTCSWDAREVQ